jgi:membrane-associated phospholipid phosphatase
MMAISYTGFMRAYVVALIFCFAMLHSLMAPLTATAASFHYREAKFASGAGNTLFLVVGTALPLAIDGKKGKDHALRTFDALIVSTMLSQGLKMAIHEPRPDGSDDKSFPSGHATAAFAIATAEAKYHPKQAVYWYIGAALIAESRLELNRHNFTDIAAGATFGYVTAEWALSRPHGVLLVPFIKSADKCIGVQVTKVF